MRSGKLEQCFNRLCPNTGPHGRIIMDGDIQGTCGNADSWGDVVER